MGEVLEAYPSALFVPDTLGRATLRPLRPAVSQTESCEGVSTIDTDRGPLPRQRQRDVTPGDRYLDVGQELRWG
ncbi:MAG: hypothetical protein OSA36_03130, partial [Acidimicrobiales bacterium]|nr:hypothetical protein [Acidimicrobiales bacterium]